jgi:hypothetical protein
MPLPLAFGNPGVGEKLSGIREDEEESDADDVSLAILRSESRATPTSARSTSRSLNDTARPQRQDHPSSFSKTNYSPKQYEDLSKKMSQMNTNASSSAFPAKPSIEDASLESDQRNDHASTSDVPSTLQLHNIISDLNELRQQQKDILQRMSSSQDDISAIRRDLKELHLLLATKCDVDDTSKSLKMLVDGLKSFAEEMKLSNVQYEESLSSLKVRFSSRIACASG